MRRSNNTVTEVLHVSYYAAVRRITRLARPSVCPIRALNSKRKNVDKSNWRSPTYMLTVHQRYRRTDGRTIYDSNIALALRVSRGKTSQYVPGSMKVPFLFYLNFGKCGPILIILLLLIFQMNCGRNRNNSDHLTPNLLPHYIVKFLRTTVQFFARARIICTASGINFGLESGFQWFFWVLLRSVSVKWLAVKTASEMTYCVSGWGVKLYSLTVTEVIWRSLR